MRKGTGSHREKIALKTAFPAGRSRKIRIEPLIPQEPVVSPGYPKNRLRFAGGRCMADGGDTLPGTVLLELHDGNDRLAQDHGASGAPVLDCAGRVVALISNVFTQTIEVLSQPVRVSTAWGQPNVVAVPIGALEEDVGAD
jgi:hypothetical protein